MKIRILSFLLAVLLLVGSFPTTVFASASNDYTEWKQYDAEWNKQAAWPASEYPNATLHYMSQAGCLITSIAMLLRHYNVVSVTDVGTFNPWICNEALKSVGALNSAADLIFGDVEKAYPGFVYKGVKTYSLANLTSLFDSGYACVVKVSGSGGYDHYVAVRSVKDSKVTIMDPGADNTSLSYYGSAYNIYYYSATASEPSLVANTLTFVANGGTCDTSTKTVEVDQAIGTLPTAALDDMVFEGWFTEPYGGTQVTEDTIVSEDMTLYAHYSYSAVKFNFDLNGGTVPGAVLTESIDEINNGRPSESLVIFNESGTQPGTNTYGKEIAVNNQGKLPLCVNTATVRSLLFQAVALSFRDSRAGIPAQASAPAVQCLSNRLLTWKKRM